MAVRTGKSCRLYQSRSRLFQRYLRADLAADALLPPGWLVGVSRIGQIALALVPKPLRRIFRFRHYSDVAVLGKEPFDRGPANRIHGDVDPGPDRGEREGRTPAQSFFARVVESESVVCDSCRGRHVDKEFCFHEVLEHKREGLRIVSRSPSESIDLDRKS